MKLILLSLSFIGLFLHDIQIAYFKIYEVQNVIHIDFKFEKEDIIQTLNIEESSLSKERIKAYVNENFSLSVNNEIRALEYSTLESKEKHIYLKGSFSKPNSLLKSIEITNTCLLSINNHSNIIEFRLFDQERDFLMNKDRTKINVKF